MAFWDTLYWVLMMKTVCSAKILLYKHLHKPLKAHRALRLQSLQSFDNLRPSPPWTTDSLELVSFTVALSPSCVSDCPCWRFPWLCLCYFRKCPALPSDSLKNCRSIKKNRFLLCNNIFPGENLSWVFRVEEPMAFELRSGRGAGTSRRMSCTLTQVWKLFS